MADEAEVKPAENALAAPEVVETAPTTEAPVSGETKPETPAEAKPSKTFSEEDVNRIVGERLARAERKLRREMMEQRQQPAQQPEAKPTQDAEPLPENFKTTEEYIKAVAAHQAKQIVKDTLTERETHTRETRAREYAQQVERQYHDREAALKVLQPDFDDVVYGEESVWNSDHPGVAHLATAVKHSERGPEIALHLSKNRDEFSRISQLHPIAQAREIGKLEAKLPDISAPAKTTTSAPAPIKPIGGGKTAQPVFSTDDPKAAEKLTPTEWIALREKERRAKMEMQGKR